MQVEYAMQEEGKRVGRRRTGDARRSSLVRASAHSLLAPIQQRTTSSEQGNTRDVAFFHCMPTTDSSYLLRPVHPADHASRLAEVDGAVHLRHQAHVGALTRVVRTDGRRARLKRPARIWLLECV